MYLNFVKFKQVLTVLFISFLIYLFYPYSPIFSSPDTKTDQDIDQDLGLDIDLDFSTDQDSTVNTKTDSTENHEEEVPSYNSGYILFNIGSQEFRERLGLSVGIKRNSFEFPLKLSYGKWNLEIEDETSYLYELKASNIGTSVAANYYITDLIPLFVHLSLSYAFWKGDITPHITDSSEFKENFRSSFNLQSLNFSLGIGWSYFFKNGIFLQHCIYGIGSGFIVKSSFSNSISSKISSASKDKLKHLYGWGLINIGIGKLF